MTKIEQAVMRGFELDYLDASLETMDGMIKDYAKEQTNREDGGGLNCYASLTDKMLELLIMWAKDVRDNFMQERIWIEQGAQE